MDQENSKDTDCKEDSFAKGSEEVSEHTDSDDSDIFENKEASDAYEEGSSDSEGDIILLDLSGTTRNSEEREEESWLDD